MNKHEYSIEDVHLSPKQSINTRCNQLLLRVTTVCFIIAIIFGYSFVVSRNSTLFGNIQDFDVTNSSRFGKHISYIRLPLLKLKISLMIGVSDTKDTKVHKSITNISTDACSKSKT